MSSIPATTAGSSAPSSTNPFQALSSGDFLNIMFAELANQDPSQPTDSKDLLQQIGVIRSIESNTALTDRLDEISRQGQVTTAGSLIGKFVSGLSDSGVRTQGFVDSVTVTRTGAVLNLSSGLKVPLDRIEEVIDPALIGIAPTPTAPTTPTTPTAPSA